MSPGHSHAPAPCRIRSTWHPAAGGVDAVQMVVSAVPRDTLQTTGRVRVAKSNCPWAQVGVALERMSSPDLRHTADQVFAFSSNYHLNSVDILGKFDKDTAQSHPMSHAQQCAQFDRNSRK